MHNILLILHIIGAGVLIGSVIIALVIAYSKSMVSDSWKFFQIFGRLGFSAAMVQLVTGVGLYLLEPDEFRGSSLFWFKIGLFAVDGIIATQLVDRKVRQAIAKNETNTAVRGLSPFLLANLLILSSIITLGVFLAEHE